MIIIVVHTVRVRILDFKIINKKYMLSFNVVVLVITKYYLCYVEIILCRKKLTFAFDL